VTYDLFKKKIICSGLISCVLFVKSSMVIADITIEGTAKDKTVIQSKSNSEKSGLATSIKIVPMRTNRRINDELGKKAYEERKAENAETDIALGNAQTENKVTVMQNNESQFIEGYKIDHNGKQSAYVYGYIDSYENGNIFGYLYDNKGSPVYFYGNNINSEGEAIYAKDKQSGNYILYSR
jgi:hypothetical protein